MNVFLFLPPQPSLSLICTPVQSIFCSITDSDLPSCVCPSYADSSTEPSQAKHSLWPEISFGGISSSGSSLLQSVSFLLFPLSFSFWVFPCTLHPGSPREALTQAGGGSRGVCRTLMEGGYRIALSLGSIKKQLLKRGKHKC